MQLTTDLTDLIDVANPDAELSDAAIESMARLLLGMVEEDDEQKRETTNECHCSAGKNRDNTRITSVASRPN